MVFEMIPLLPTAAILPPEVAPGYWHVLLTRSHAATFITSPLPLVAVLLSIVVPQP
jgi:hypothetical protein